MKRNSVVQNLSRSCVFFSFDYVDYVFGIVAKIFIYYESYFGVFEGIGVFFYD